MSDFGTGEDFETVRDGLEKNRSASATDEALAALDRIEARLRKAQEGREWFLSENAKLINERNRGWHNHELPDGLTSHSHTQGPYAHLREAEAEADRQERYIEALEAERDDLAGEQGRYLQERQQMKAERDRLQGMLDQAEEDLNVYLQQTVDVKAENARLREAEAEADRLRERLRDAERAVDELEAERDQWKAGTFPGWTRDDVFKRLADKYRELEAERDELRGALERA